MRTRFFTGFIALVLLLFLPSLVIADGGLVRGAVPGELYIYGVGGIYPDWVDWLYRSTDYGQTVYLQNDAVSVEHLAEGVDPGELYKYSDGSIYYSDDFGVSFVQKSIIGSYLRDIASGYAPGEVYAYIHQVTKYSTDYGETFVDKGTCPAWVFSMSVGHSPGEVYCGCYHGEVYYSSNYGETYELIIDLANSIDVLYISRGSEASDIYFFGNNNWLYYSPNQGDTLYQQYYFDTDYVTGIAGGFIPGEVYVLESEHYFMGGGDLYIHRSADYGQTFIARHVYSGRDDTVPPKSIDDLTCTTSDSSLFLDWSPINKDIWNRTEQVDYYVVYRHQDPDFEPSPADSVGFSTTSSYLDSGARWTTQAHYYVVKAVDDSGNKSGVSNRVGKMNFPLVNEITFSSEQERLEISSSVSFGRDNHNADYVPGNLHSFGGVSR